MTRHVLHVAQPVETGVAEVVLALARHQLDQGHRVTLACPPAGMLPDRAASLGATVIAWPARRQPGPSVVGETRRLGRIVAASAPDIVHLHSAKAGLAGRLAIHGARPTVFQPHAWSFHAANGVVRTFARGWERGASRWTDRVIAVSAAEGDEGRSVGVRAPITIAPNGVDTDRFVPVDDAGRAAARAALGLADAPTAVCVGRLCRQKGQDVAVAAWCRVRAAVPDAVLVLVGDGPDEATLAGQAGPGVVFAGAQRDVVPWLAAADVVVAPSRWEGQSLALLEAMASGRAIVATDVAGVRESLGGAPAGRADAREVGGRQACGIEGGAIVAADDPAALADVIAARLRDPGRCAAEGAANRTRAVAAHGVAAAAARVDSVYAEVLAARAEDRSG